MRRDSKALWIITADHIFDPRYDSDTCVGRRSLAVTSDELVARCTVQFKLYDDDGVLYYEGKMAPEMLESDELAFEPLDWATGFAGATRMDIRNSETGVWATL